MTAKRYRKLFRSEMSKLMAHRQGAANCIKGTNHAIPFPGKSYAESWNELRKAFTYKENIPPIK